MDMILDTSRGLGLNIVPEDLEGAFAQPIKEPCQLSSRLVV